MFQQVVVELLVGDENKDGVLLQEQILEALNHRHEAFVHVHLVQFVEDEHELDTDLRAAGVQGAMTRQAVNQGREIVLRRVLVVVQQRHFAIDLLGARLADLG